jgi:hypothetical protein
MLAKKYFTAASFVLLMILCGCNFIKRSFQYSDTSKQFIDAILNQDYDKSFNLMAMDREEMREMNRDTLKMKLAATHDMLVKHYGNKLNYTFKKTEKFASTKREDNLPPNTTLLFLEFDNGKDLGMLKFLFDDTSGKVINLRLFDIAPVPNMLYFWLFSALLLLVFAFNVYVIIQIKRSTVIKKWKKYLPVILFNVPTLGYNAMGGFFFKLIYFQLMLGISFAHMGYSGSSASFGIPIGAIYVLWKLRNGLYKTEEDVVAENQLADKFSVNTNSEFQPPVEENPILDQNS